MLVRLHSQATTTPKIRAAIQSSDDPAWMVAERFGTTEQTVYKWRHRDTVEDRSHTPHRLQTTLTPAQEVVAVVLRKTLLVSLDDLLAVVRELLNPNVSRSGLDRCLRRQGVGNLRDLKVKEAKPKRSAFKAYEPGYLHIDVRYLPQIAGETSRRYLFVAIDRATRWVFIGIYRNKTAANARRFLRDLERACPLRIRTILTDNGKEFTDRLFGLRKRATTGEHEFDRLCTELGIDHRLTPPRSPQTNGMVERFNGRIEDVLRTQPGGGSMTAVACASPPMHDLTNLIGRRATMLSGAKNAAEVLEAREAVGPFYVVAKSTGRLQRATRSRGGLLCKLERS